jgi:protein-disulfide isomerase
MQKEPKTKSNDVKPKDVKPKDVKAAQRQQKSNKTRLFVFAAAFLLLAFVAGAVVYKNQQSEASAQAYARNKSTFVREHSPAIGNAAAKVEIVEFFDPACETCKEFYPLVKKMMASNPDRIRLVVRYAPFHTGSDYVVKILEAAKRQGKFWETLEAVFASQASWAPNHRPDPQLVWNHLGGLGLDITRLRQDMNASEIEKAIQQDLADAKALNVKMTPEFFVNGKPMPSFGYDQLRTLVVDALDAAYK